MLFIATLDNYIELYTFEDAELSKKTIRYSLMKVEHDNKDHTDLFRCHKSYMVNKSNIESISGNAAGYKLKLLNYHDLIPVSRKWNKYIQTVV